MKFLNMCRLLDFISVILIYFVFFFPKWRKNGYELFVKSCLYVYGVGVLYVTLIIPFFVPIPFINIDLSRLQLNLVPYIDYIYSRGDFIRQTFLNILMLVPLGILIPFIYKKSFKETLLGGFLVSAGIEFIQLLSVRQISSCDVTDILNNTFGVLIGYVIYKIFDKPVKKLLSGLSSLKSDKPVPIHKRTQKILLTIILIQLLIRSVLYRYI